MFFYANFVPSFMSNIYRYQIRLSNKYNNSNNVLLIHTSFIPQLAIFTLFHSFPN